MSGGSQNQQSNQQAGQIPPWLQGLQTAQMISQLGAQNRPQGQAPPQQMRPPMAGPSQGMPQQGVVPGAGGAGPAGMQPPMQGQQMPMGGGMGGSGVPMQGQMGGQGQMSPQMLQMLMMRQKGLM